MAATKEAMAIVLDVGPGMSQALPGVETDLQVAVDAVNRLLQRKMFAQSKDEIALVLFGTDGTANDLADGESYENVTLARPLGLVDWELLQYMQNDVQPSNGAADFLDAIVVAMDHVMKGIQGKKGFGSKRIVLLSNLSGEFGDDQLDDIIGSMKEADINLDIIGPDLDNDDDDDDEARPGPSNGHTKAKSAQQRAGEALARHINQNVEGDTFSFQEALPALSHFQSRQVRSVAWKSQFQVGSDLAIPICLYNRIKEAKASGFKKVYAKDPDSEIERVRTFHLNDEEETEIDALDVVDGHRYGSTLVPFSKDDKDAMKYRAEKCFKLLCFASNDSVRRNIFMGDATWVCTAEKGDESAAVALSALINAMYELNTVAIVRRVYSASTAPKIGCLVPHIKTNHECLIYNELPFTEDMRQFTFGSLPVKEDNTAANQKLAPSDEQLKLMDNLIDNMDLTAVNADDDDDEKAEALKPKLTFNPYLQRLYQCLQHRALNPDEPLPALSEVVASYLKPLPAMEVQCQPTINSLKEKCKLELVAKEKKEETADNVFKAAGDGDGPPAKKSKVEGEDLKGGMAELVKAKVTEVGTVSPVQDFKDLLARKDQDMFETACDMMQKRITQLVMDSFGSQSYGKAMDCLKCLREQTSKNSEPKVFNDYLCGLKDELSEKGRADFWDEIVQERVTLISKLECEESGVTQIEATDFLKVKDDPKQAEPEAPPVEEADDLLDDM